MSDIAAVTYTNAVAVTVSDTTADPAGILAALQCTGTAGLAKVQPANGSAAVVIYLALGVVVPLAVSRVWSTGTAATNIIGFKAMPISKAGA
jgi:hypothetical protein